MMSKHPPLTEAEKTICRRLYKQKYNDYVIAEIIGRAQSTVQLWRKREKLPPNGKPNGKRKQKPINKPFRFSKTMIQQKRATVATRPERERLLIKRFATDLVKSAADCEEPDIGAFINEWPMARREFVNGLSRNPKSND